MLILPPYNKIITGIRLTVINSIVDTNSFNLDPDWDPLFWPNLIRIQGIVMEKKISYNQISSLKNVLKSSVSDPDPNGSGFFRRSGSGF